MLCGAEWCSIRIWVPRGWNQSCVCLSVFVCSSGDAWLWSGCINTAAFTQSYVSTFFDGKSSPWEGGKIWSNSTKTEYLNTSLLFFFSFLHLALTSFDLKCCFLRISNFSSFICNHLFLWLKSCLLMVLLSKYSACDRNTSRVEECTYLTLSFKLYFCI